MKINRLKVALSMIIPFLLVFITLFVFLYLDSPSFDFVIDEFMNFFVGTSILWLPSVIICLIMDLTILKSTADKKKLRQVLIAETIVASIISLYLFPVILVLGIIGNVLRYQYLVYKGRVFETAEPPALIQNLHG